MTARKVNTKYLKLNIQNHIDYLDYFPEMIEIDTGLEICMGVYYDSPNAILQKYAVRRVRY